MTDTTMNNNERFNLSGRKALVTGSSRGIGAAIAVGLAEAGADVVINYAGNREAAEKVAQQITDIGRQAPIIQADLMQPEQADALYAQSVDALGGLDIVIANASVQYREHWRDMTHEQFLNQMNLNVYSTLRLIQLAAPAMLEQQWGRIISIGSVQEARPGLDMMIYASTKAAQTHLIRNFAKQFAAQGVTVNNLAPGAMLTDRNTEALSDLAYREAVLQAIPARRFGEAQDCVGTTILLCSEAGAYITGQSIYIDGGIEVN